MRGFGFYWVMRRAGWLGLWWSLVAMLGATPEIRVVSQTVGTDELLLAVADPGQIACLSHIARSPAFSAVAEEAKNFPALEQGDAETILKYHPTLVLASNYSRAELIEQVRRTGTRVMIFDHYATLEDAYDNLRILAGELGGEAPARAETVIRDCQKRVETLEGKLRGVKPVRVIAPSTYNLLAGTGTTFDDLCLHAGADNLAASVGKIQGHQVPPGESMLTWPVDKVVISGDNADEALAPYTRLSPYQFMEAVRKKRVALIKTYMLSSVSHHRVEGYECLARELHPEMFTR